MGIKVTGGAMPNGMSGAIAVTFAAAEDFQAAVRKGVAALQQDGFTFEDIESERVRQIPVGAWQKYVEHVWPELSDRLPSPEQVNGIVERGEVFFGPFLGYEQSNA
jgi:hypothetical protein